MSRSKHTRPAKIIAADRVRSPRASRSSTYVAETITQTITQLNAELETGAEPLKAVTQELEHVCFPRIRRQPPRKGYYHPASPRDIKAMLHYFGELSYYGVREIQLAQRPAISCGKIVLAKLSIPGKIILFEQPFFPWSVGGTLEQEMLEILEAAGAQVENSDDGCRSKISWSAQDLRKFMLFEGLMHEVGHHIIQQFKGKRTSQVLRLKDHELLARNFARRCREEYCLNAMAENENED